MHVHMPQRATVRGAATPSRSLVPRRAHHHHGNHTSRLRRTRAAPDPTAKLTLVAAFFLPKRTGREGTLVSGPAVRTRTRATWPADAPARRQSGRLEPMWMAIARLLRLGIGTTTRASGWQFRSMSAHQLEPPAGLSSHAVSKPQRIIQVASTLCIICVC